MIHIIRRVAARTGQPLIWKIYKWYMGSPRWYHYQGIKVRLLPTVFHPGWLISTRVLLEFLTNIDLKDKYILELGAGSGLIGLYAVRMGASATVTDINPKAIEAMRESSLKNNIPLHLIHSDLFENIPVQIFDFIIINPPYFPRKPKDDWEVAFYCGEEFEYFYRLFDQIRPFIHQRTNVYMILNEYCAIDRIKEIAAGCTIDLHLSATKKKYGEEQYIFELNKIGPFS